MGSRGALQDYRGKGDYEVENRANDWGGLVHHTRRGLN